MPTNPKIRDFTSPGSARPRVETEVHSAVDLLIAMWLLDGCVEETQPLEEYQLGAAWFTDFSESLTSRTRALVERVGAGYLWISAMSILDDLPSGSTVDDFINHVGSMDPPDLRLALLSSGGSGDAGLERLRHDAAAGDGDALATFLGRQAADGHERWAESIRRLVEMDPRETIDLVASAMRGVHTDAFASHEKEFRPILERDAAVKQATAARVSTERFVELATNGISIEKHGYRRPILLTPSIVGRPWNIFTDSPTRMIIAYPVADESMHADPDAPPAWLVKTYKALGDERRLRVLRRLSRGPASLHELANELAVSKSTLHHHMMLLRSAGLVKISIGTDKEYALRENIVPETTAVLQAYIDNIGGN